MSQHLLTHGCLCLEDLAAMEAAGQIPSAARRRQGPVAIVECVQNIPCNPCESSCKAEAIAIGGDITATPAIDDAKCSGCGVCVSACPGQAIFIVDEHESHGDRALVTIPYELLPLPEKGETVLALDRAGQPLGPAEVVRARNSKAMDATAQVTIAVPRHLAMTARFFKRVAE